jgi:rhodanese-related sulfurtransferase
LEVLLIRLLEWIINIKRVKENTREATVLFTSLNGKEAMTGILLDKFQVLDVRTPGEYETYHISDSILIPAQELENRYTELNPSRDILVVCERGVRSQKACRFLSEMGFKRLYNLDGGLSCYKGPKVGKNPFKIRNYFWRISLLLKRS